MVFDTLIAGAVGGLVRNVAGWAENAFKDGKVSSYEWGQLLATVFQVATVALATSFAVGTDPTTSGAIGVLASFAISTAKKIGV